MQNRIYTYIAGDWDHDKNAVDILEYWRKQSKLKYLNAHDTKTAYDDSLNCSIKKSLKARIDISKRFVLIVGNHTDSVTAGGCQLCPSYNSYWKYCARGYSVDYDSFIKYECKKADEAYAEGVMSIIVLYNSTSVNKYLCPEALRYLGYHIPMIYKGYDGKLYWDYNAISKVFSQT